MFPRRLRGNGTAARSVSRLALDYLQNLNLAMRLASRSSQARLFSMAEGVVFEVTGPPPSIRGCHFGHLLHVPGWDAPRLSAGIRREARWCIPYPTTTASKSLPRPGNVRRARSEWPSGSGERRPIGLRRSSNRATACQRRRGCCVCIVDVRMGGAQRVPVGRALDLEHPRRVADVGLEPAPRSRRPVSGPALYLRVKARIPAAEGGRDPPVLWTLRVALPRDRWRGGGLLLLFYQQHLASPVHGGRPPCGCRMFHHFAGQVRQAWASAKHLGNVAVEPVHPGIHLTQGLCQPCEGLTGRDRKGYGAPVPFDGQKEGTANGAAHQAGGLLAKHPSCPLPIYEARWTSWRRVKGQSRKHGPCQGGGRRRAGSVSGIHHGPC